MFDLAKKPEWPAGRKVGITQALIGLKEMYPKAHESVVHHLSSPQWAKDREIVERASPLAWTPMRYLAEIGTHAMSLIGEQNFLRYWEDTNLRFMDSSLLRGALNVFLGKATTVKIIQYSGAPWQLSAIGCGDLSIVTDPGGKAATVTMSNIPAELSSRPTYAIGWRSVYSGLLRKCGEKNITVTMDKAGSNKFTLHCKWG